MENCGDFSVILWAFINEIIMADGKERRKNKMDIFVAELLDCTKG